MQLLVDTVGCVGEMMRDGRLMLLEPLCQWLAGYAAPPKYALDAVALTSYRPGVVFTENERIEAWKYHFRELLKDGE